MKRLLLILLILSTSNILLAQSLSIKETIEYINDILYENGNYQTLKLKENGKLVFSYNSSSLYQMDILNFDLKHIEVRTYRGTYVQISFKGYAIQRIDFKSNKKENHEFFNISNNNWDAYTSKKFANALKYLISIVKSSEKYNLIDDDPFAPTNFNPNSFEIISDKSKEEVKLFQQSGVFFIGISIGGITEQFIFDTGASDVLISKELERLLISNGYLKRENYLTDGFYRIADGSIVRLRRLLIPELKIGNFTLLNIEASVTNSNTLLLGKSVLDKFKSWNINNLKQTLELTK